MTDNRQEELLSAYLDAELSSDQQAEVEQLLATQPEARQLLDDLRALSGTLQSLPRERVGQDLSAQVLRRAERAMLATATPASAEPAAPAPPAAASTPAKAAPPSAPRIVAHPVDVSKRPGFEWSLGRSRRGWVWAALTLAAALLLMLFDRNRAPETQLAKAPQSSADGLAFESRKEVGEMTSADAERASDSPTGQVAQDRVAGVDQLARARVGDKQSSGAPALENKSAGFAAEKDGSARNSRGMQKDATRNREAESGDGSATPRDESVARGNRSIAGNAIAQGKGAAGALKSEDAPAAAAPAAPAVAIAAPAVAAQSAQRMVVQAAPAQAAALSVARAEAQAESTEMLVVHVHVTAEALRDGAFEQVMATQNIHWELQSAAAADANRAADKRVAADSDADARVAEGSAAKSGRAEDGAASEPPARRAAVELLKQLVTRESQSLDRDAQNGAEEESLKSNVAPAAPLADAPAKVGSLSRAKPQGGDVGKLAERQSGTAAAGKGGVAIAPAEGVLADDASTPTPQYAVLVESSPAHLKDTLAQLAADDRFVAVELVTSAESTSHLARGLQPGGGGQANGNLYFDQSGLKSRAFGALTPVDGKAVASAVPAPGAVEVADQPAPSNKPIPAEPKSDVKSDADELRAARPAAKLQMRSDLAVKPTGGQPASGARAWRIELPQRDDVSAPGEAAAAIAGKERPEGAPVAGKKAFGRALPAPRQAELSEFKRKSDSAKGEQSAAAPGAAKPSAPQPLSEKSKTVPAEEPADAPAAPVAAAATAQAMTLSVAPLQQPVRVLFVVRVAAAAEPAAKSAPAPAAGPAPAAEPESAPPKQ